MSEDHFFWVSIISNFYLYDLVNETKSLTASDNFILQIGQIQNFIAPSESLDSIVYHFKW